MTGQTEGEATNVADADLDLIDEDDEVLEQDTSPEASDEGELTEEPHDAVSERVEFEDDEGEVTQ